LVEGNLATSFCEIADTVSTTSSRTYWIYFAWRTDELRAESGGINGCAKDVSSSNGSCTVKRTLRQLILDVEIECIAFMSATNQLFGEGAARTAGSLWAEELEASPNHFRGVLRTGGS
jgi:hypothetical protein